MLSHKIGIAGKEFNNRNQMDVVMLQVKVKPRANVSELTQAADGTWIAKLKSPPVDGKANRELIRLVAEKYRCGKSAVSIKAGAAGRTKLVRLSV